MASWYLGKIRYQKEDENGRLKTTNEAYLVDALTYTEAEARLYGQIVTGITDFTVTAITRMRLADLLNFEGGEKWFKAKVVFYSIDEKSGKEKKVVNYVLLNAEDITQALERITESQRTMLIPYETTDMNLTPILDVFPYEAGATEEVVPPNFRPLAEVQAEQEANA
jgi:hypothetical protein